MNIAADTVCKILYLHKLSFIFHVDLDFCGLSWKVDPSYKKISLGM